MRNPTTVAAPPLHCADHTCAAGSSPIPSFAISSVQPRGGPTAGGTKVQLRGRGLHELVDCAFGPYPRSRAFAVDPDPGAWAVGGVACHTPPVPVGEAVEVRAWLAIDPPQLAAGAAPFLLYDPPQVRALAPPTASARGGALLTVRGAGFGPYAPLAGQALCRFGSADAEASRVEHVGGGGDGGGDGMGDGGGASTAAPMATLHNLSTPAVAATAEEAGGIVDRLRLHYPRLVTAAATVGDDGEMRCVVPPTDSIGPTRVEVSLNGGADWSESLPRVHLDLYDNWVRPHLGGVPPSWRVGHAWARAGDEVYLFGGTGSTWRKYGAVTSVTPTDEDDNAGWTSRVP